MSREVEQCLDFLKSDKITERKKSCMKLSSLLQVETKLKLNEQLVQALQICLNKDVIKSVEARKKGVGSSVATERSMAADLLVLVIKMIIEEENVINIPNLIGYIIGCLNDSKMMKYYGKDLLCILQKSIFPIPKCSGELKRDDWSALYTLLKNLIEKVAEPAEMAITTNCFMLLIKRGPLCGMATTILREDFDFMTKFCQKVSRESLCLVQEDTLEVAVNFCEHTAKDNRVACCKFGEDIARSLISLYEVNGKPGKTKELLVTFFILQMIIHHPNGATEGNVSAYAYNWKQWKRLMNMMYNLLGKEINLFFKCSQKNTSFFKIDDDKMNLCQNFSRIFVEISRQVFLCSDIDITPMDDSKSPPAKRQKTVRTLRNYIDYIQETKSWLWINLVSSIIKTYPDLIAIEDYIHLLGILSSIQIENNDFNVIDNVYFCLSTMVHIEKSLDTLSQQDEIDRLWKLIGASATRAFGLNQHNKAAEKLLRELINRGIIDFEEIFQTYQSGVLTVSEESIKIFDSGLKFFVLNDINQKELIMKCILQSKNPTQYKYLCCKETANFLVKLTFKEYMPDQFDDDSNEKFQHDTLREILLKSLLDEETLVTKHDKTAETAINKSEIDFECAALLIEIVEEFISVDTPSEEILFSKIILLANISDCLIQYDIVSGEQINDSPFIQWMETLLGSDGVKEFSLSPSRLEREIKSVMRCVELINILFSLKLSQYVVQKLRELIPRELLKTIFAALNNLHESRKMKYSAFSTIKVALTTALSNFACICGNSLEENQIFVLDILSRPTYNCRMDEDYHLLSIFLKALESTQPGVLPESVLANILECIENMCRDRYYIKPEEILDILCGLFPLLATTSNDTKENCICLLKPFYDNIENSGPSVSISMLNCIQTLYKLDLGCQFQWSDVEIIKYVPEFLKSDHIEVRLKAIDVLTTFYETNSKNVCIRDIHRQEEIFSKIYEESLAVFQVSGELTDERRIDECVSRTASVLLTFINIVTCDNWLKEGIYALLRIAHIREIEQSDKAFHIMNKRKFGKSSSNILEIHLSYLIEKWINDGCNFDDFPYGLLNCTTKYEFYKKYFDDFAHLLIINEPDVIAAVAENTGLTEKEIVQRNCAKIFSRTICSNPEIMTMDILNRSKVLSHYLGIVGHVNLREMLKESLDLIIIGILDFLTDQEFIESQMGESVIFFIKRLDVSEVQSCFEFIETFLCDDQPLGLFLTDFHLSKFENIMLELKTNIFKCTIDKDRIEFLHRYTFFIDMITKFLNPTSCWRYFFIRDVVYTLLNIIDNNETCIGVISASCRFLQTFLKTILPELSQTFKYFLIDTINSLKKFYVTKKITSECKNILQFLIITNMKEFEEEIKNLDTFPNTPEFCSIRVVQTNTRYGSREPQIEDEINQFLNHKDILTKEDSLVHLREALASKKNELMVVYDGLQEIRGFSEDCEDSVLHRLVCALSQLTYSTDQKISFEAARCLGELGPSNLQTLVLQPEKVVIPLKHSPLEIILGSVVSILIKYLIDRDIDVIKIASKILYLVFDSKEGKKIVESTSNYGFGPISKDYIIPYFTSSSSSSLAHNVVIKDFELLIALNHWCPDGDVSHDHWITVLVSSILETYPHYSFLNKLVDVCKLKVDFCEYLLPLIIELLMSEGSKIINNTLTENIDYFFSQHWELTVQQNSSKNSIALNKKSVKSMLNVINYLRLKEKYYHKSRTSRKLTLNYLKIARAAEFCANHFSALYYSELWCQEVIEKLQRDDFSHCEKLSSMIDFVYENQDPKLAETLHNILRNAYKSIGDYDALPGCGTSFLLQPKYRVEHYKELGKFDQVIQFYANQALIVGSSSKELFHSFKMYNLYQVPVICSQTEEPEYECLWRLSQWTFEEKKKPLSSKSVNYEVFEKYRFYSLKALHNNNQAALEKSSTYQFLCIINHLKNISLESSHNLYPILTKLEALKEMEDFSKSSKHDNLENLFAKWKLQDKMIRKNDFRYVEPIIVQRLVMLKDYLSRNADKDGVKNYIADLSLSFAGWAKDEGHCQEGLAILESLKRIADLDSDTLTKIDLLDAQLSWSVDNTLVARQILNRLCKDKNINPKLHSLALKLKGEHLSETHTENRTTIISNYFLASCKMMSEVQRNEEDQQNLMDTYEKLALFADKEYQQIKTYMQSDVFQKKITNMEQGRRKATSIQKQRKRTHDEMKAAAICDRNSTIDYTEISTTRDESNEFLIIALKYYLLCLIYSDNKDIRIFRIIALFLENRKNEKIFETMNEFWPRLPSHKFIITLPQLIPHLSENDADSFSTKVNEAIELCAKDHPYHTLPLLLSLANAYKDRDFDSSSSQTPLNNDGRVITAKHVIAKLKQKGLSDLINKLDSVSYALIELAYYKSPDERNERKKEFDIPRNKKIIALRNFDNILVPTCEWPINVTKNYSNIVGIHSFKSSYQIVGGINKPKKICCKGTDGKLYTQLVKGHDDLRQDAVMQQVFTIMNNLLSYNKSTKHLRIRTYKIVPLSMRSGILKWADNSMPIGEYLIGTKDIPGAHQMYRPNDKLHTTCRESYKKCANKPADSKLRVYKEICRQFRPVMHHFFEQFFPQPAVWYERRRAYIQSVATTSMCGYILGIGDRHTSNILIDKTTAEVIHIDFGIAFEQGRVLPTPETVPFRLTRDIVDGMGVSGVEGLFKRSCEKTMEVLRQNSQTIMTILEVLLYDPLYEWTLTSAEAKKRQTDEDSNFKAETSDSSEEPTNVSAERALLRLREKLQGTELGHPRSIEHQVATLIQQAVDPENLCKLFVGWQPYV